MMALLTLPGPQFLTVFFVLGFLELTLLSVIVEYLAPAAQDAAIVRDPYVIAYLRGELDELIRVVTLSLTLRGLLKVDSKGIQTVDPTEVERAREPIEKVVLTVCRDRRAHV